MEDYRMIRLWLEASDSIMAERQLAAIQAASFPHIKETSQAEILAGLKEKVEERRTPDFVSKQSMDEELARRARQELRAELRSTGQGRGVVKHGV